MNRITQVTTILIFSFPCLMLAQHVEKSDWIETVETFGDVLPPIPTSGGLQFWEDVYFFNEWRIQENTMLKMYRLLDPNSIQYGMGSYKHCKEIMDKIRISDNMKPAQGRALVVLHGLASNRITMARMASWFKERGDYALVINITYASTQKNLQAHTDTVASILRQLDGITEMDLVGHSMGSIILRNLAAGNATPVKNHPLPKIRRLVQICPPNQGSHVARHFNSVRTAERIVGGALNDLALSPEKMLEKFGIPQCKFGIISGGTGHKNGYTPLLDGDDDGVICVKSTHLTGAADFILIPGFHAMIPNMEITFKYVDSFMKTGRFTAESPRKTDVKTPPL